jgi:triphosphoribosyl-dephospho-CoA synthase
VELRQKLVELYQHVCWLDVESLKPGNVSVFSCIKDLEVDDFLASSIASAEQITEPNRTLGKRILNAIIATQKAVRTNTNLGIILLIAPLIQARYAAPSPTEIKESLTSVLQQTTVEDACDVYQAIHLANPGGMGKTIDQDIYEEPTVSLLNTMKIAADWDQIAAQYTNNFDEIFSFGAPLFQRLTKRWQDEKWATTGVFMGFLAHYPDSLIKRKFGHLKAREISDMISALEMELCRSDSPGRYEAQLLEIDRQLKQDLINPGTTADLTAASIFAAGLNN